MQGLAMKRRFLVWTAAWFVAAVSACGDRSMKVAPISGISFQGACDMGGLPNVFPAYQPVNVEANNEKFFKAWGKDLSDQIGYTITDMIQAMIDGKLKALYVVGENPKVSDPNQNHLDKALDKLELLIFDPILGSHFYCCQ